MQKLILNFEYHSYTIFVWDTNFFYENFALYMSIIWFYLYCRPDLIQNVWYKKECFRVMQQFNGSDMRKNLFAFVCISINNFFHSSNVFQLFLAFNENIQQNHFNLLAFILILVAYWITQINFADSFLYRQNMKRNGRLHFQYLISSRQRFCSYSLLKKPVQATLYS